MSPETKTCVQCKIDFKIESEDIVFYEKFQVPAPQMCPLCRAQRRMAFRNERVFYKRKCDKCAREVISMYSPNKPYTVYCYDCWFADDWDALDYAREYDPKRPFLDQFKELWDKVPKIALVYVRSVNSEYVNISADSKDCYMLVESSNNEGCIHCYWIQQCRDLVDVSFSHQTELSYECDDCFSCYGLRYSKGCHGCRESYFLFDCVECSDCIGCVNLRKKQYYIFNQPYSKEDYERFLREARLDTHEGVEAMQKKFEAFLKLQPHKYAEIINAPRSTGNYIKNAKSCTFCFHCYDAEDSRHGIHVWRNAKDCMDVDTAGRNASMIYNSINAGMDISNYIVTAQCWSSSFMEYSYYCFDSNHCFGSAGARKKNYLILNKQYEKAEYEKLRAQIVEVMKKEGSYGEFFPISISTFGYNESAAQEQFPLTKEQALAAGYKWEDAPRGTFGKETISWDNVPDSYENFDPTKHIFTCMQCSKNYLVIPNEFTFYKKMHIPLPRLCPDCRHNRRFRARGPNHVVWVKCTCGGTTSNNVRYKNTIEHFHKSDHCPNEFWTNYMGDHKADIVYCEQCYQAEVI